MGTQVQFRRHPELVSGSIGPQFQVGEWNTISRQTDKWTLKQVQGDECGID